MVLRIDSPTLKKDGMINMAFTRKAQAENQETKYQKVTDSISVCGTPDRFSIQIDGICKIHGCRLVDGKNGTFIGMPRWKGMDGTFHNCASLLLSEEKLDFIMKFVDEHL